MKLRSTGRGRSYSKARGVIESILGVVYQGDWPAALYGLLPKSRRVRRVHLRLPVLDQGAKSLRIGFLSDIHFGPTTSEATIERAFALLAEAKPDLLLLGGDYVFLEATRARARKLAKLVESVPAPQKFAVMGNHDLWTAHPILEEALSGAGVRVLINDSAWLDAAHASAEIDLACAAARVTPGLASVLGVPRGPFAATLARELARAFGERCGAMKSNHVPRYPP